MEQQKRKRGFWKKLAKSAGAGVLEKFTGIDIQGGIDDMDENKLRRIVREECKAAIAESIAAEG